MFLTPKMSEEIRRIYQLYKNGFKNLTIEEEDFCKQWHNKMRERKNNNLSYYRLSKERLFETFKEIESELYVDEISVIFRAATHEGHLEMYNYMIDNYPFEILTTKYVSNLFQGIGGNEHIIINTDNIEILRSMREKFPDFLSASIPNIFKKNFCIFELNPYVSFKNGNCDIISYLADNYKKEILAIGVNDLSFHEENVDCIKIMLEKIPEYFDNCKDFSIACDDKIAEIFIVFGIGKKIDPLKLHCADFLVEYQKYLHIEEFLSLENEYNNFSDCFYFIKIISLIPDFLDYDNAIERNCGKFLKNYEENIGAYDKEQNLRHITNLLKKIEENRN